MKVKYITGNLLRDLTRDPRLGTNHVYSILIIGKIFKSRGNPSKIKISRKYLKTWIDINSDMRYYRILNDLAKLGLINDLSYSSSKQNPHDTIEISKEFAKKFNNFITK